MGIAYLQLLSETLNFAFWRGLQLLGLFFTALAQGLLEKRVLPSEFFVFESQTLDSL